MAGKRAERGRLRQRRMDWRIRSSPQVYIPSHAVSVTGMVWEPDVRCLGLRITGVLNDAHWVNTRF